MVMIMNPDFHGEDRGFVFLLIPIKYHSIGNSSCIGYLQITLIYFGKRIRRANEIRSLRR